MASERSFEVEPIDPHRWLRHECFACESEFLCPIKIPQCPKCGSKRKFYLMN